MKSNRELKMTRDELVKLMSQRLTLVRERFGYSRAEMATAIGSSESTIAKNERAQTGPDARNLYRIAHAFNVSLDWLVAGRGDMLYKEAEEVPALKSGSEQLKVLGPGLREDITELLLHMEHLPLLRYEILSMFQHFKANNKELVAEAIPAIEAESIPALPEGK